VTLQCYCSLLLKCSKQNQSQCQHEIVTHTIRKQSYNSTIVVHHHHHRHHHVYTPCVLYCLIYNWRLRKNNYKCYYQLLLKSQKRTGSALRSRTVSIGILFEITSIMFRSTTRGLQHHTGCWHYYYYYYYYSGFWRKTLLESDHLEKQGVDRRIILKRILKKEEGRVWTEFLWFRTVTSGALVAKCS